MEILVFAGSSRKGSFNKKLAQVASEALQRHGLKTTFVDLIDYPMPIYDQDLEVAKGLPEQTKAFKKLLRSHEAFLIVTPEHNGSFSALLKNVIDWTSRAEPGEKTLEVYRGKTAAIAGSSPGGGGGKRALKHLRELLEGIGVKVIPTQVAIPVAFEAFDADGNLVRPADIQVVGHLAEEFASALGVRDRLPARA